MTSPRVLCIAGSPRRHGNSERLLDALAEGVEAAGGMAIRLAVADMAIGACRGCHSCSATGHCAIRDDMDGVYALLDSAQAIAIATPVYFASVPASLKALYDRCQPYWARRFLLGEPPPAHKRPGALLVVGGGGDPFGAACAVTPTRSVLGVLGFSLGDVIELVGPDAAGDVEHDSGALERTRMAGETLVSLVVP